MVPDTFQGPRRPKFNHGFLESTRWINGFYVIENEKFIDIVSDSTLQLIFKKLSLVKFLYSIKKKYQQLLEKAIKILSFVTSYQSGAGLSTNTLK